MTNSLAIAIDNSGYCFFESIVILKVISGSFCLAILTPKILYVSWATSWKSVLAY